MTEEKIREYIIEGLLGRGGMGSVYLARHKHLDTKAALKVLLEQFSDNPSIKARFVNEAKLLHNLQHKNIVQLREFFEENGRLVLVLEYVDGNPLDKMIGQDIGPIPWEKALPLFTQILDGIGYAHSKNIVHRDIKPANILISKEGQVKVTDLGIAKIAGEQGMTRTGAQMGTLYYESPEQIKGAKDVDHRSDIYSLGMTLYEMLAGRLPFATDGDTSEYAIMDVIVKRVDDLDPRDYYPHIPEWLVKTIQKATELHPEKRFQSCEHFKQIIVKYGKLSESENTFWSEKVASVKSIPILTSKSISNNTKQSSSSKGKNCPMCSEPVEKEMEFCGECGTDLTQKCPACLVKIRWNRKFCPKCGTNIENYLLKQAEEKKQKELQEECKHKEVEVRRTRELKEQEQKNKEAEAEQKRLQQIRLIDQRKQRFSKMDNIITDKITGLEWQVGSDEDINWNNAKKLVINLGSDWRMPSLVELQELYKAGITSINWECFQNSGFWVWSSQIEGSSSAWRFTFGNGFENSTSPSSGHGLRAFAVRSR